MLFGQIVQGVGALAVFGHGACLAAHNGVFCFGVPVGPLFLTAESALVVGAGQIAIVVSGQACLCGGCMRLGARYRVGQRPAVHFHFEPGSTQFNLPVPGESVQKGIHDVFARQVIFRALRIHVKIGGVIPFAPAADETCLQYVNHVCILLQDGLKLGYVTENLLFGRIERSVILGMGEVTDAILVAKAKDDFDSASAEYFEVLAYKLEVAF